MAQARCPSCPTIVAKALRRLDFVLGHWDIEIVQGCPNRCPSLMARAWGFFDRLLLIVTKRVGELVVVFGDQIDIALVLDRGDRRLQRVIELAKCFLLVAGRHFLVGLNLRNLRLDDGISTCLVAGSKPASTMLMLPTTLVYSS